MCNNILRKNTKKASYRESINSYVANENNVKGLYQCLDDSYRRDGVSGVTLRECEPNIYINDT